ncbi:NAD-dependent epimerase/dehydratase family protein [uncultured Rikenella sp.]|uniref:NAD-dependent epimerase/dehydratase family protein n=1 Tax=uncultured Rikenella sp. TaxID=368003 RepID=UPI0025F774C8|nr:NAD-dependent epimerase/dehydratase family protein [uncultured Rikenella sp.]
MNREKIAILGAGGFTGKHFIDYLQRQNTGDRYEPILIDITPIESGYESHTIDACDHLMLKDVLDRISPVYIVNLMGILRSDDLNQLYRCNVEVSRHLMQYAVQAHVPVKKILLIGSVAEYGFVAENPVDENFPRNPVSAYGLSKVIQQEEALYFWRKYHVPVVIARTFNLIGQGISNQLAIGAWREKIAEAADRATVRFGNLESYRDYMEVKDVVDIYWKLLLHAPGGEVYNVCSGSAVQMRTLLEQEIAQSGKNITIEIDRSLYKPDDLPIIYGNNSKLVHFLKNL